MTTLAKMPWSWRDPKGLRHTLYKRYTPGHESVTRLSYVTACNLDVTVDDVPNIQRVYAMPTCIRCVVAPDEVDVINGE